MREEGLSLDSAVPRVFGVCRAPLTKLQELKERTSASSGPAPGSPGLCLTAAQDGFLQLGGPV